jgi:hypothetical protein
MKFFLAVAALCGSTAASPAIHDHYAQITKREVNGSFIPTTAPKDNLFRGISAREQESIFKFLEKQANKSM